MPVENVYVFYIIAQQYQSPLSIVYIGIIGTSHIISKNYKPNIFYHDMGPKQTRNTFMAPSHVQE